MGVVTAGPRAVPAPPPSSPALHTHLHELLEQAEGVDRVQAVVAPPVPQLGVLGRGSHGATLVGQASASEEDRVGDGEGAEDPSGLLPLGGGVLWARGLPVVRVAPREGGWSSRAQVLHAVAERLFQTHDDGHLHEQVCHAAAEMALRGQG